MRPIPIKEAERLAGMRHGTIGKCLRHHHKDNPGGCMSISWRECIQPGKNGVYKPELHPPEFCKKCRAIFAAVFEHLYKIGDDDCACYRHGDGAVRAEILRRFPDLKEEK